MIHPTAMVHPKAVLDSTVNVGPYALIDESVVLGAHCIVGPHVYLTGQTKIGAHNRFHAGCVIGDAPQDLKYAGEPTGVTIGDHNVFREHVTVHRSTKPGDLTIIGSNNLLMATCHVGHNSVVGNHVILANGALLGGHVSVGDRAFISGTCLVHQFTRVGTLALMQGGAGISKDLPPYTVALRQNKICGLNVLGLRRAGIDSGQRLELKRLYHFLFRSGGKFKEKVSAARERFSGSAVKTLLDFVDSAQRGVCSDVGTGLEAE
jgi:UDP-N-acetylglucosamine acyltransferase